MAADYPSLEHADAIEGVEAGGLPVTGVSAGSDAGVPVFGDLDDVVRIPDPIVRIVRLARVVVDADADVEFFDQWLDQVEPADVLSRNPVEAESFGKEKNATPLFFGRLRLGTGRHHAVVDRL